MFKGGGDDMIVLVFLLICFLSIYSLQTNFENAVLLLYISDTKDNEEE